MSEQSFIHIGVAAKSELMCLCFYTGCVKTVVQTFHQILQLKDLK